SVVAVKEASGDLGQMAEVLQRVVRAADQPFYVVSGDDALTLPLMAIGGHGVVSVASNLVPERMVAMVEAARTGDFAAAREIYFELLPIFQVAFVESNPVPIKAAMNLCGIPVGSVRSPLAPLTEASQARLENVLRETGLID
ncbi:MAG: 4-hydroxy-tetrahydrodipicolinate synthase, partial [Wenzhouxiangella sp.]